MELGLVESGQLDDARHGEDPVLRVTRSFRQQLVPLARRQPRMVPFKPAMARTWPWRTTNRFSGRTRDLNSNVLMLAVER
jgi:hypothetical protein